MTNRAIMMLAGLVLAAISAPAHAQQIHLCQPRVADHVCMSWHSRLLNTRTPCDRLMMIEPKADRSLILTCDVNGEGVREYRHSETQDGDRYTLIKR